MGFHFIVYSRGQALAAVTVAEATQTAFYSLTNPFPMMILKIMETPSVGETWCSESEGMLSEGDNSDCELAPSMAKK